MKVSNRLDKAAAITSVVMAGINPNDGQPYYIAVDEFGKLITSLQKVSTEKKAVLFSIQFFGFTLRITRNE